MSIRFNADASKRLTRATDILNSNNAYTFMLWVYVGATGSWQTIYSANADTLQHSELLEIPNDASFPFMANLLNNWSFSRVDSTTLAVTGTWYHLAIARENATTLKLYVNGVNEATNTADVTGRTAPSRMEVGQVQTFNPLNARVAALKAWSTALTGPQILAEMSRAFPIATSSVYAWWPCQAHTDVNDKSGNARHWTAEGSLTTEADPPGVTAWTPAAGQVVGSRVLSSSVVRGI